MEFVFPGWYCLGGNRNTLRPSLQDVLTRDSSSLDRFSFRITELAANQSPRGIAGATSFEALPQRMDERLAVTPGMKIHHPGLYYITQGMLRVVPLFFPASCWEISAFPLSLTSLLSTNTSTLT